MYIYTTDSAGWRDDDYVVTPDVEPSSNPLYAGSLGRYDGITINYPKSDITPTSIDQWYHAQTNPYPNNGDLRSFVTKDVITTQAYNGNVWQTIN